MNRRISARSFRFRAAQVAWQDNAPRLFHSGGAIVRGVPTVDAY